MNFKIIYKLFVIFVFSISSHAWEVNTHRLIDQKALISASNLQQFMTDAHLDTTEGFNDNNLVYFDTTYFNYITYTQEENGVEYNSAMSEMNFVFQYKNYKDIIEAGSILEDATWTFAPIFGSNGRFLNHFYNPQDDGSGFVLGINALDWGKGVLTNQYSFENATKYMLKAFNSATENERKTNLAKMYVSVGHIMHLFNDMNVPAHVRNDGHNPDPLEFWMKGGEEHNGPTGFYISGTDKAGVLSGLTAEPNKFIDFQTAFISEATRTSTEFLSKDALFDDLPLPSLDGVSAPNPSSIGEVEYATKNGIKLAVIRKSYLWGYDNVYFIDNSPVSNVVHEDYGKVLIPRAIANASGFVNYFFRGHITTELTSCGLKVKNNSNASLVANANVVTFKKGGVLKVYADNPNDPQSDRVLLAQKTLDSNLVAGHTVMIKGVIDAYKEQIGELSTNVPLTVVYDGDIGSEKGVAVSYGLYDLENNDAETAKDGVVEVSLNWESSSIDMDLELINWEDVGEYDVKDIGCPTEHYVIEDAVNVKPGRYFVNVKAKDIESIDDNISENINIITSVLGKVKPITTTITNASELDMGNVAEIIIEYKDNKPIVSITPKKTFDNSNSGGSGSSSTVTPRTCQDNSTKYSCGCMPCFAKIIPYLEQALAGPLSGADVELHIASEFNNNTPLLISKTSLGDSITTAGIISIPKDITDALDDNEMYIVHVRGGIDIDSNDDFELDNLETLNRGSLHSIVSGEMLKSYGYKLNLLTEIAYQNVKNDIGVLSNQEIFTKLDEIATLLMNGKIDTSTVSGLSYVDLITWLPAFDKKLLHYDYDEKFEPIVQKIYKDEDIYQNSYDVVYGKSMLPRIQSYTFSINENAGTDTLVGTVVVVDEGQSPIENFSLVGKGSENFYINQNGEIKVSEEADIDFEKTDVYSLKVIAKNADGESFTNISIIIVDTLDAPKLEDYEGGSVFSNAIPSTYVATAVFNQGASSITEITLEGNGHQYFDVDLNGNIVVSDIGLSSIVANTKFFFTIKAKNKHGYSSPETIVINVLKVASEPSLKRFVGYIDENSKGGGFVGKVSYDTGTSAVNAFVLSGNGSENFTIDLSGSIYVKEGAVLDYETKSYYGLTLSARNDAGTSNTSSVLIYVNDLEDVPVLYNNKTFDAFEDVDSETVLGNVLKSPGLSDITEIRTLNTKFRVDMQGNLYLAEGRHLDYETATHEYVSVIATNSYGDSLTKNYTIAVKDVVDTPVLVPLVTNVAENSPAGTIVGTISYTDGTSPISSMNFIQASPEFSIDLSGTIRVKSGANLDYETKSEYTLSVYATNDSGNSQAVDVVVNIGNRLDAPELNDITYTISENSKDIFIPFNLIENEGLSPIISIEILDINLSKSQNLQADINGSVYITATADLDFEKTPVYTCKAIAYNNEGASKPATIKLNLVNVLDAPELEELSIFVDENESVGTVVGQVSFNEGVSEVTSMRIYSPFETIPFFIDKNGVLKLSSLLDYETTTSYSFSVYATNENGESRPATINVKVNDILDNPILQNLSVNVDESVHGGDIVGTILYQEGLDEITSMVISGEDSTKFNISSKGVIRLKENVSLDYEDKNLYSFSAQAFSKRYNSNIVDVNIIVNDVDEYAEVGLGRWGDASVNIYKIEDNGSKTLMFNETTSVGSDINTTGLFDSHKFELEQNSFYLYEVSGGEEYDANNDGIIDATPRQNKGTIHAFVKGSWVRDSTWRPRVNLMTEVYYQWVKDYLDNADEFDYRLTDYYSLHINNDLNEEHSEHAYYTGNAIDALIYNPLYHLETWNPRYFSYNSIKYLQEQIYKNNPTYPLYISNSLMVPNDYITSHDLHISDDKSKIYSVNYRKLSIINVKDLYENQTDELTTVDIEFNDLEVITTTKDNKYLFAKFHDYPEEPLLKIYDITNNKSPIELSSISVPNIGSMKLSKDEKKLYYTFISNDNRSGFGVVDISDFSEPIIRKNIYTTGYALDFVLSEDENIAYITDDKGGVKIIDINNDDNFKILSEFITDGLAEKILLSADKSKVYVSVSLYKQEDYNNNKGYLNVIDISDKNNPVLISNLDLNSSTLSAFRFNTDETKLFVSSNYPDYNDKVYEVLEQYEDVELLGVTPTSWYTSSDELMLIENETFMLAISYYKIDIIDINDPSNPIVIKRFQLQSPPG